ncbi:hypothetical protein [Leptothermofonsia sp. ETS-13]|uniref:hypothetical protein n=1 Tax=Leptothermofonsia sp. ETS-13 TaxID=3035696 RepID=UPI003BA1D768
MQTDRLTLVLVLIVGLAATAIGVRNLIWLVKFVNLFPAELRHHYSDRHQALEPLVGGEVSVSP